MKHAPIVLALALAAAAPAARAHAVLAQPQAAAGSSYRATFVVTHGCEGTPTHTVTVGLPPGFRGAKPMPKPGWTVEIRREPLAEPYESHGRRVTDDVVEITWRAASREAWLADAHFDEFVLRGQAPAQPGIAWFRLRQLCERGEHDWAQKPAQGHSTRGLKSPAIPLDVVPAKAGHPH